MFGRKRRETEESSQAQAPGKNRRRAPASPYMEAEPPCHVAVIMDGNGRWAAERSLPRAAGHAEGLKNVERVTDHAMGRGIRYLTLYALSTENMQRPREELDVLFDLFREYFVDYFPRLLSKGGALKIIGDVSVFPEDIRALIRGSVEASPVMPSFTLVVALNYGARSEMIRAVNAAVIRGRAVTEDDFPSLLYTAGVPDPDLIIRTGGEERLSNFLLWQAAYSELYFTDAYFPDFDESEFDLALEDFAGRDRRYGRIDT